MLKRLGIYLNEMFPLSAMMGSIITAVAIQLVYLRLHHVASPRLVLLLMPALVLTAISLLIRIMDEFKDYQDDLTNFPSRPLPSGRVKKKDLKALAAACVFVVISLSMLSQELLIWAFITLGFTFLMLKWFFIENIMRRSLPLAFVTHHPIVVFNFVYLLIACTLMSPSVTYQKAFYVLPVCFIFTNWEIMRKIRAPEQETSYTTYSKIMGPRPAVSIAIMIQLIFSYTVFSIFSALESPIWLRIGYGLLQAALFYPSVAFLLNLKLPRPLKAIAEGQILLTVLSLLIAGLV